MTASLPNDVIGHMVFLAPWTALNSLVRTCLAATRCALTHRDVLISTHLRKLRVPGDVIIRSLPNGVRHGDTTRANSTVTYSFGRPTRWLTAYLMYDGSIDTTYGVFGVANIIALRLCDGDLVAVALKRHGREYIRTVTIHADKYVGWKDAGDDYAEISGGEIAANGTVGGITHTNIMALWRDRFRHIGSNVWREIIDSADSILAVLFDEPLEPPAESQPPDSTHDVFPGVPLNRYGYIAEYTFGTYP